MPQSYIYRMVAMDFRRVVSEEPIDIESDVKDGLSPEECQRMNQVKSSLNKYTQFKDAMPQDEMDEMIQEEARRSQVGKFPFYTHTLYLKSFNTCMMITLHSIPFWLS